LKVKIEMTPIGRVNNEVPLGRQDIRWEKIVSTVALEPRWAEGLEGITEFSHVIVIFYLNRIQEEGPLPLKTRPMGRKELPEVGIFSTRTPYRPNGIGVTVVELLGQKGSELRVRGLDAYHGTPVLDIKPYLSRGDQLEDVRVADWTERLWQMLDTESPSQNQA
jgi:tRNA-Thr(GGU) m(6)t(6)A37 methyltransferase TsaA